MTTNSPSPLWRRQHSAPLAPAGNRNYRALVRLLLFANGWALYGFLVAVLTHGRLW